MTTIVSETRERFLIAIAAEIPVERIEEIHLFTPINQGGVESGVAVVAVARPAPAPIESEPERGIEPDQTAEPELVIDAESDEIATDEEAAADESDEDKSPYADDEIEVEVEVDLSEDDHEDEEEAAAERPRVRFTVYTARYLLVRKGPDRGKWTASVVAEADAPLLTVETVVRGVQRRSGDIDAPERMSGDEVRDVLSRATRTASR